MKLFVYGSLKPGGWSSHLLEPSVDNPRDATITGYLFDCGGYPALQLHDPLSEDAGMTIHGIIYDVIDGKEESLLARLDYLEGYPVLFNRTELPVIVDGGAEIATLYFGVKESLFSGDIVEDGIWNVI